MPVLAVLKRSSIIIMLFAVTLNVKAQESNKSNNTLTHITFDFNLIKAQFGHLPPGINQNFFSVGFSMFAEYKIPLVKNHLIIFTGAGVTIQDLNFNGKITYSQDLDTTYITPLDKSSYTRNKMNFTFIEFPVELRYNASPNSLGGFMVAGGISAGYLADDFVKTTGVDKNGNTTKVKVFYTKNLTPYRWGIRGKIGYDGICLFGYYNLLRMFENNQGPPITYYAVGVSLGGF